MVGDSLSSEKLLHGYSLSPGHYTLIIQTRFLPRHISEDQCNKLVKTLLQLFLLALGSASTCISHPQVKIPLYLTMHCCTTECITSDDLSQPVQTVMTYYRLKTLTPIILLHLQTQPHLLDQSTQ